MAQLQIQMVIIIKNLIFIIIIIIVLGSIWSIIGGAFCFGTQDEVDFDAGPINNNNITTTSSSKKSKVMITFTINVKKILSHY